MVDHSAEYGIFVASVVYYTFNIFLRLDIVKDFIMVLGRLQAVCNNVYRLYIQYLALTAIVRCTVALGSSYSTMVIGMTMSKDQGTSYLVFH